MRTDFSRLVKTKKKIGRSAREREKREKIKRIQWIERGGRTANRMYTKMICLQIDLLCDNRVLMCQVSWMEQEGHIHGGIRLIRFYQRHRMEQNIVSNVRVSVYWPKRLSWKCVHQTEIFELNTSSDMPYLNATVSSRRSRPYTFTATKRDFSSPTLLFTIKWCKSQNG